MACHNGSLPGAANVTTSDADSFSLISGHTINRAADGPAVINECSSCHDPHAVSAASPMMPRRLINRHTVPSSGPGLCLACHDDANTWAGFGYPSMDAPIRNSAGFPIQGTFPGSSVYRGESNAHRLIPESSQTAPGGEPVDRKQGDCLYCHAAHRSANAYDGLVGTFTVPNAATLASDQAQGSYAALCLTCHGTDVPSGFTTSPVNVAQFVTASDSDAGHRIVTAGGSLPVGSPLPCYECHNPHGSARDNDSLISDECGASLGTTSPAGVRQFCFTCHTTGDSGSGWNSDAQAYVPETGSLVVGLPRDGAELRLSEITGHDTSDTISCYDCHGASYAAGGNNVHDPASGVPTSGATVVALAPSQMPVATNPPLTTADLSESHLGTVTLSATDSAAAIAETYFELDGSAQTTGTVAYAADEGTHTLEFWSVDALGNVETPQSVSFLVDRTPPETTSDALPSYAGSATITLSSSDGTLGAGVAETYYELDGSIPTSGTVVTTDVLGTHLLTFWSVDAVGNAEDPKTAIFSVIAATP